MSVHYTNLTTDSDPINSKSINRVFLERSFQALRNLFEKKSVIAYWPEVIHVLLQIFSGSLTLNKVFTLFLF